MLIIFLKGLLLGASLIIAIGAQNAFILRQGIKQTHILPAILTAAITDALLIGIGVLGFSYLIEQHPTLITGITWGGAIFLFIYGLKSFLNATKANKEYDNQTKDSLAPKEIILITLGLSLLNPHVYLDTIILIGGLSASHGEIGKYWFGGGAIIASLAWFFALGYGAKLLTPLFHAPRAWKILDILIGLTMWIIAVSLII